MNKYKIFAIFAVLCAFLGANAQNVTTPYSMYGYGIIGDRATSMQKQMGGVGVAMNSGRQINVMNPASYASIDSLTFLFDMGADVSMLWQKEGSAREHSTGGGLDYITMQFPIGKYMGGSIGMLPYSSVGYAFGNEIKHGAMENQGSGGINMAYLGLAGTFAGVSLGVNVSYNFGNIQNDIYSQPENAGRSLFEHVMQVRDWDVNVGLQYTARWHRTSKLVVGATWSPKKSLHGNSWCTVQELTNDARPDTVATLGLSGNYFIPMSFGGGISYTYERASRIMVEADILFQQWSKAGYAEMRSNEDPEMVVFQGMKFNNRTRYAVGAEYVPNLRGSFFKRMNYRLGAYYCDDYLNINGNGVREYGVTAGVGLPTIEGKTMINLGLEWKHRSAHPQTLISENYFNITLGINFNELWFWQRKIR